MTEAKIYADYLKKEKPNAKVGILYQNDGFGKDLSGGFEEALKGSDVKVVAKESYEVTDPSVASQVKKLSSSGADTFLDDRVHDVGLKLRAGGRPDVREELDLDGRLLLTEAGPVLRDSGDQALHLLPLLILDGVRPALSDRDRDDRDRHTDHDRGDDYAGNPCTHRGVFPGKS